MIPILMYHQVAEIPRKLDPKGLAIPPNQFEQQILFLNDKGYRCLSLTQAVKYLKNGISGPSKSVVITFDDGYQDVHSIACPILEKYGFSATIFLVAGRMGSQSNWWGQDGERAGLLLSRSEAKDLANRGHIIGSHTFNHPFLTSLDDRSAFEEIQYSKAFLQDRLNLQIDYFSYPYSHCDNHIEQLVRSAGYRAACAGNLGPQNLFRLWRVPCLRDDTLQSYSLKVSGWYNKKFALRESFPGRFLRQAVRKIRNQLTNRHNYSSEASFERSDRISEHKT